VPDTFSPPTPIEFHVPGGQSVAVATMRRVLPFDYDIIGAVASLNTAPTGADFIVDVLRAVNNSTTFASIWPLSNGTNVQTITLGGTGLGGTFTLTYGGQTTGAIAFNASAAAVQAALNALTSLPNDVVVTGAAGGPYVVTFNGGAAPGGGSITYTSSLTGTAPTITITKTGTDNRPRVKAGNYDQAAIAAGTTTVAPMGTDPPLSGGGLVSTTTTNYDEIQFLAKPDANNATSAPFGFAGNSPIQEGNQQNVLGTPGVPQAPQPPVYSANAGDALNISVLQVGSTVAGSDLHVMVFVTRR
jgi:hypothetical protein